MEKRMMAVPDSPKREKTGEGPPQIGAGEPAPSSSSSFNPAPLVPADENLPDPKAPEIEEAGAGDPPAPPPSRRRRFLKAPHKYPEVGRYIDDFDDKEDPPEVFERMRWDTAIVANEALEYYNSKEGTNYVLRNPLHSWCSLFPGQLIIHANFKAKNIVDPSGQNNPPSELFFSETVRFYRQPSKILTCLTMDKRSSDINRGCLYCPSHIRKKSFYHPPMGKSEFGEDQEKDDAQFEYEDSSSDSAMDED
ncbi:unnamed protein product [Linum tenue]|uniref:DUF3615 domain-containing protein n=2 Tax=Linum tenue TaxID=586396 RepID=A0AAV0GPK7_9ROSI|nr:unnamed protein product [Linum tenue]